MHHPKSKHPDGKETLDSMFPSTIRILRKKENNIYISQKSTGDGHTTRRTITDTRLCSNVRNLNKYHNRGKKRYIP